MKKEELKGPVHSVGKAMELLELFFLWRKPMSLRQIAEATQYPKSTIHSLLSTLREYGVVVQEESGRYYLGARLYEYGCAAISSWDAPALAHQHLEMLAAKLDASTFISLLENDYVISFDRCTPNNGSGYQVFPEIGMRLPLHATAQGKLFLSFRPDAEVVRLLERVGMTQFTPHTITDPERFLAELRDIRRLGYAVEDGEYKVGLRTVAAPVYDYSGSVKYAVGTVGLFRRTASAEFQRAIDLTVAQARQLSADLRFRP